VPAALQAIEEERLKKLGDFLQGEFHQEAAELASIQEACRQKEAIRTSAVEEVKALQEVTKKLSQDSHQLMARFNTGIASISSQWSQLPQKLNTLAEKVDRELAEIDRTVVSADGKWRTAIEAQARERELRDRSEDTMQKLNSMWQEAMKRYLLDVHPRPKCEGAAAKPFEMTPEKVSRSFCTAATRSDEANQCVPASCH
jgi:hypothetical protein